MANIITSLVVTIAFYWVGKIFGRVAPYLVGLFDAVAPQFAGSVRCEIDYLFDYHSNIKDVKDKREKLRDVRDRVDGSIKVAKGNADEIRPHVAEWLESVNKIIKQADEKFPNDEGRANGWFHNLKSRYQLSKKAKETAAEIVPKIQDGKNFSESGVVSYRAPPQGIGSTATKGYEAFKSRMSTLEEVMVALKDDNVSMIGISGMAGVGKTMLVEEVARKVEEDKSFDKVVMVVVSKTPDKKKIQEEIGYRLGLGFGEECDSQRKNRLCRRLKNENSILVILDDIWEKLDLEAVGIPCVKDHKVMLTSRSHGTLRNEMGAQKNFVVKVLSDEEGWNLFKKIAGHSAEDPKLKDIAEEVAKKCGNLPLAISAVAKALKDKGLASWQNALRKQKMSTPTKIFGIDPEAYNCLKWSFDYMRIEDAKKLLRLCCILPEDHHISIQDILKYGKGLDLFQGITTEDARIEVQALVDHLKDNCLLLDGHTTGFFRIHGVFRDVGISISVASRENHILVVRDGVELSALTRNVLENCVAMSLPSIDIRELPQHGEGLQCPKLQLLLWLSKDQYSLEIPDTFFEGMEQLKVLNLTNIVFSSLPSLSNLQTLCLEKSKLTDLSRIGELKNLEILSFRESDIKTLPTGIGQLTRLWLLDLSHCSDLNTIPSNVIARLSGLEELYMGNSFVEWKVDGTNASLVELTKLSRLVTLEIGITDAQILPDKFCFEKLKRYRIFVGVVWDCSGDDETSKTLKLKLNAPIPQEGKGINMLLGSTEVLYLDELNGTSSVLYSLDREGFPRLKHLYVQNSCEIKYVINSTEPDPSTDPSTAFPELESLFLLNLSSFTDLCYGQPPGGCFCKLKILKVERCGTLEKVLKMSMAGIRKQLQVFEVDGCDKLEVIVANNETDKITFPQLHSLKLKCLPVLVSFCAKVRTNIHSPNYTGEITPEGEPHIPIPFFNKKVAFQNLKLLNIERCDSLRNLFSPSMANDLVKLRALKIINCQMMEEIVEKEKGVEEEAIDKIVFRLLSHITLQDLPKLTSFYPGDHTFECPSLQKLTIHGCPRIKKFTSTYKGLQVTFGEGDLNGPSSPLFDEKVAFQNLKFLTIECCASLRNLFSPSMANDLVELRALKIINCPMMEEIVEKEKGVKEEAIDKILFRLLSDITLQNLPNLTSFYPGDHTFECPSLKKLTIKGCPKVKKFTSTYNGLQETSGEGDLNAPSSPFFDEKVVFPCLEDLDIDSVCLKEIWHSQLPVDSFCNLKYLKLERCNHLLNIVPSNMVKMLQNIVKLSVSGGSLAEEPREEVECLAQKPGKIYRTGSHFKGHTNFRQGDGSLEYIFDLGGQNDAKGHVVQDIGLSDLYLYNLPSLRHIWKMDSRGVFNFENLSSVQVRFCRKLRNIFSTSIATTLKQLQKLKIERCGVEDIVGNEGVEAAATVETIVLPQLISLSLIRLKKLRSFCQGNIYISEWKSLKKLVVSGCEQVEVFASKTISFEGRHGKGLLGIPTERPLFLMDEVAFPNLEELELSDLYNMEEIWQSRFHTPLASKLRSLKVEGCRQVLKVFPSPQNLQYLQVLSIGKCPMLQEIFGEEGEKLTDEIVFHRLTSLSLYGLDELKSFCKATDKMVFPQLTSLSLSDLQSFCQAMDKMVFPKLTSLTLDYLPRLKSLCQGIHVSEYSSLKKLEVSNCQGVEIFASEFGQPLFLVGKVAFLNLEELKLYFLDGMKEIWGSQFHSRPLCKLRVLNVENCNMISRVFPISLLQDFQNLEVLAVSQCDKLEEVFDHGGDFGEVGSAAMLPHLRELKLNALPRLKHLLKEDSQVAFHDLEKLELCYLSNMKGIGGGQLFAQSLCKLRVLNVEYCPKISKVFPISLPQDLQNLEELTVQRCDSLEEVFELGGASGDVRHTATLQRLRQLKLTWLPELMHLWKEDSQLSPDFQNLTTLEVWYCESLTHLLPFAIAKTLVQIKSIIVRDCKRMKEIITIEEGEATDDIIFSQLNSLELEILPNLTIFCRGSNTLSFPSLVKVNIRRCPELKTFSDGILNTPELNEVLPKDYWEWKGDLNTTIQH